MSDAPPQLDLDNLWQAIQAWAAEFGFAQVGVSDIDLNEHEQHLQRWLAAEHHGEMGWMASHGSKRSRPEELVPGTVRVLSVRMDYLPQAHGRIYASPQGGQFFTEPSTSDDPGRSPEVVLSDPERAYIARYTLGRDYHKLIRKRLAQLARRIEIEAGGGHYRAFVDSAPVLERALAEQAGLGWIAKNTMLINRDAGSWFFLGEIYTDLPLPVTIGPVEKHCGSCTACLDVCPTDAFVGPFELDARRCISYLTIEHKGSIDPALRPLMGNRVFGCDDCQLVCPWNKFAHVSAEPDFAARHALDDADLVDLFSWDEATYLARTEGSALRRIGYERWLRNLAIALGNAPTSERVKTALTARLASSSELVREHVTWALQRHGSD